MSAHAVVLDLADHPAVLRQLEGTMAELGIGHVTIQLETGQECEGELCGDEAPSSLMAGRSGLLHGDGLLHRH